MTVRDPTASAPPRRGKPTSHGPPELEGFTGLSDEDAELRLQHDGPNELPSQRQRGVGAIIVEVVREPMFLLLVAGGALYLLMGKPLDALMLFGFVGVVIAITVVQARRTDRALEALRDLSSPRALVVRGGQHRRIAGRDVVRGDLLILAEGDRVPADAILRRASNMAVDESILTGESVPVHKTPSTTAALDRPGGDGLPSLFSSTLVTAGQGVAEVAATGARSELGKIGSAIQRVKPEATRLQRETGRLVRILAIVGLSLCAVVVLVYALMRGGGAAVWKEGLLAGVALAMAILPEEFPVVLTVFLALGAWRISRSRVLTRRMPAVETLGATTVLCVDKTGTLTMNQMTVRRLVTGGQQVDVPAGAEAGASGARTLLETAALASRSEAFDPMERALHAACQTAVLPGHPDWVLVREYPLSPELLAVSRAWQPADGGEVVVASVTARAA